MATATMATAAGMAMLLYFVLVRRLAAKETEEDRGDVSRLGRSGRRRVARRQGPAQPPATWREAVATLAETLRFTYSETLGKWPIGDLAFGIKYLMRRQVSRLLDLLVWTLPSVYNLLFYQFFEF